MLSIPVKEGDNIERALKRFKKKFDRTKRMRELRVRKEFVKPSVIKREAQKKAVYKIGFSLKMGDLPTGRVPNLHFSITQ